MQNFIITYILGNPITGKSVANLVVCQEIFEVTSPVCTNIAQFRNHKHIDLESGLIKCKELVSSIILNKDVDINKDINRLKSDKNALMLLEIMISVKFNPEGVDEKNDTFKKDFEHVIRGLNEDFGEEGGGIFRRLTMIDTFKLKPKMVFEQTYVYSIINNRK